MNGIAIKAMVKELAPVIREYAEAAQAPLLERITLLETEKAELSSRCDAAEALVRSTAEQITADFRVQSAEEFKALLTANNESLRDDIDKEVAPLKAENDALRERIKALEARPAPELLKGEPGEPGKDGADGQDGKDGADGQDGSGIADLLRDHEGNLVASFTDGRLKNLGPIQGKDGQDGRDGFGFDELDACVLDDDRTIELSFRRGEEEKAFTFKWPTVIYRHVFKEGEQYEPGDMVTWGGSLWHCDKATSAKPGTEDWTLAAKKGRDGKDAKIG